MRVVEVVFLPSTFHHQRFPFLVALPCKNPRLEEVSDLPGRNDLPISGPATPSIPTRHLPDFIANPNRPPIEFKLHIHYVVITN